MAKVVYLRDLRKALRAKNCSSQWERGCAELAVMVIERVEDWPELASRGYGRPEVRYLLEHDLLNGAADWAEYAAGGSLMVADEDIAALLCPPSVVKARRSSRGGMLPPNPRETWLDVEGRAAERAWRLIRTAAMNLTDELFSFYEPGTAFLSAPQAAAVSLARAAGCTVREAALAVDFDGLEYYMDRGGRRIVAGR